MRRTITLLFVALLLSSCDRREKFQPPSLLIKKDDFGHTVTLRKVPKRIVSLAPNITETLFALDLDSSIVGVTDFCDYPEAANHKPKIGGILNPNIERILALHPDLVLMTGSGNMKSDYDKLTASGAVAFVSFPRTLEGIFKSIRDIGVLTSKTSRADSLVAHFRQRRDDLTHRAALLPRKSVLMLVSLHPIVAVGSGTFLDELITLANGENIAKGASTSYPLLSREAILRRQPDVILATNDLIHSSADIMAAYPEFKSLVAVQRNHVATVDASIVSRPGPRIVDGLQEIFEAIHFSH